MKTENYPDWLIDDYNRYLDKLEGDDPMEFDNTIPF